MGTIQTELATQILIYYYFLLYLPAKILILIFIARLVMTVTKKTDKHTKTKITTSKIDQSNNLKTKEIGGYKGPDPTRYGDWEKKGRCIDF